MSKSEVSRETINAGTRVLTELAERDLSDLDVLVVYLDEIVFGNYHVLAAVGVDADGCKHVLGLCGGASENTEVTAGLLENLVARGLRADRRRLFVIDGAKALLWQSIQNSTNPMEFEAYLEQFPNGVFRVLVQARLAALCGSTSGATPAAGQGHRRGTDIGFRNSDLWSACLLGQDHVGRRGTPPVGCGDPSQPDVRRQARRGGMLDALAVGRGNVPQRFERFGGRPDAEHRRADGEHAPDGGLDLGYATRHRSQNLVGRPRFQLAHRRLGRVQARLLLGNLRPLLVPAPDLAQLEIVPLAEHREQLALLRIERLLTLTQFDPGDEAFLEQPPVDRKQSCGCRRRLEPTTTEGTQ